MTPAEIRVDAPPAFAAKARWAIETLLSACGSPGDPVTYPSAALPGSELAWRAFAAGDPAPPALLAGGMLDFGDGVEDVVASAFWHLSRWEERPGSLRDRHGRFPASAALADPEQPAVDALVPRFRGAVGAPPADRRFTVALTHDVDVPRRGLGARSVLGAAARSRHAARERRGADLAAELRGLAGLPLAKARGADPNWSFARIRAIEAAHGGRSTYFVLGGHTHRADGPPGSAAAYDRLRAAVVEQVLGQGDEVGLHPSYEASERPPLIAEQRDRLAALVGAPVRGVRFHYLRHQTHGTPAELEGLGFAYDSSQGFAEQPGLRAGFSLPFRPFDLASDRPLGLVELPLAVMDATLAERHYCGLTPEAGLRRATDLLERVARVNGAVAVLWHNDRFAGPYARGWDRVYDRLLGWVAERGGRLVTAAEAVAPFLP